MRWVWVVFYRKSLAIVCSLGLLGTAAHAQEAIKTCTGVDAQSITVSTEDENRIPASEEAAILLVQASKTEPGERIATVTGIAIGPILGSMDSAEDMKTDLECTQKGILLTATITRSADFHGSVLQNILWRPQIKIDLVPFHPDVVLEVRWKMRLTSGGEVNHAQTLFYSDQNYPITVSKTLSSDTP